VKHNIFDSMPSDIVSGKDNVFIRYSVCGKVREEKRLMKML